MTLARRLKRRAMLHPGGRREMRWVRCGKKSGPSIVNDIDVAAAMTPVGVIRKDVTVSRSVTM
jgi:hypothetical protein